MSLDRNGVEPMAQVQAQIAEAVEAFDWSAVRRLAGNLAGSLRATNELEPKVFTVLRLLLDNRQYDAVMEVADAALAIAPGDRALWRHYAQALVDQGRTAPALRTYMSIADDPAAPDEDHAEARGGIGRCYKKLFLAVTDPGQRLEYLRRALEAYGGVYQANRDRYWHGINAAALLAHAAQRSMTIPGIPNPAQVATDTAAEVLLTVDHLDDPWAAVTASEAYVALQDVEQAVLKARVFVSHPDTRAFMIASFLRQLLDVWQVELDSQLGITLLPLLRSALVQKSGGAVTLTSEECSAARVEELERLERGESVPDGFLEKVFGVDRYQTLQWWRTGLVRCRAVVRIDDLNGYGRGTGFLIEGSALHPSLPGLVVVTNAHVVSDGPEAIEPDAAVVAFHGVDADFVGSKAFKVRRVCWYSPWSPPGVDTTLLELEGLPEDVNPVPLVNRFPKLNETSRAYIIGHPKGYDQPQFSIQDNLVLDYDNTRLHYRSPTEGGSSGSPVFESQWEVMGLHHAGSSTMSQLHTKGTYPANEALRIDAIRAAIGEKPPTPEHVN